MGKGWLLVLIGVFLAGSFSNSFSQCKMSFEYSVEQSEEGGQIVLKKKEGQGPVTFRLYDVLDGKEEFIKTVEFNIVGNRKQVVFKNLKPSTYLIQAESKECKITIGDLGGIIVSKQ